MTVQKWVAPDTIATILSTELNSLANGALSAASAIVNNETGLYQYMAVELYLGSLTPTGTPYCNLYLAKQLDGTNVEYTSLFASHQIVAVFPTSTATADKRVAVAGILIPPLPFWLYLENRMGPALASSGNLVRYRRYNEQSV